jgi:hypothetical protein
MPLRPEYLTIPKYAAGDVPHWSPGKGRSFIDLSRLKIHNECNLPDASLCRNATFQILMFEEPKDANWMTYWPLGNFCCTSNMITEAMWVMTFISLDQHASKMFWNLFFTYFDLSCPLDQLNKMIIPTPLKSTSYLLRTISVRAASPMTFADNVSFLWQVASPELFHGNRMRVCRLNIQSCRVHCSDVGLEDLFFMLGNL